MKRVRLQLLMFIVFALVALPASAALITDLSSWQTAMSGKTLTTETFTTNLLATTIVTPLPGSNTHSNGYPRIGAQTGTCGTCSGTVWRDFVDDGRNFNYTTTFSTTLGPFFGFGAIWDTAPNLEGGGITITVYFQNGGSETISPNPFINDFDGWRGFTSTVAMTSFKLSRPACTQEHFQMDNLVFATNPSNVVPEPGTYILLGSALLGLGLLRRRK